MKQIIKISIFLLLLVAGFVTAASAQTKPSQRSLKSQMDEINKRKQYRARMLQSLNPENKRAAAQLKQQPPTAPTAARPAPAMEYRTDSTRVRRGSN